MIVRLRRMTAKQDVAIVVHGLDRHAGLAQDMATVAAPRAPEWIKHDLDSRLGDGLQIHELAETLEKAPASRPQSQSHRRADSALGNRCLRHLRRNRGLDLLGHFGQSGRTIMGGELDAVVLRRIVRGGEVDRAGGLDGREPRRRWLA